MRVISPYLEIRDDRGSFSGIINSGTWGEANYVTTRKGEVRGGHYHKYTEELFFIIEGNISIIISDTSGDNKNIFEVKKGDIFIVEPYEVHTFTCLENSSWINFLSERINAESPDIHRPSPK